VLPSDVGADDKEEEPSEIGLLAWTGVVGRDEPLPGGKDEVGIEDRYVTCSLARRYVCMGNSTLESHGGIVLSCN
jgi:hypothetical protein